VHAAGTLAFMLYHTAASLATQASYVLLCVMLLKSDMLFGYKTPKADWTASVTDR